MPCTGCFLAWIFSRLESGPNPLILSPTIVNWLLNPLKFEPNFSIPDSFQVKIITEIYDETRVNWRIKTEFRFFLVDFVKFLIFVLEWVTIKKLRDFGRVLNFYFSRFKSFFKQKAATRHPALHRIPGPYYCSQMYSTYAVVQLYHFTFQNVQHQLIARINGRVTRVRWVAGVRLDASPGLETRCLASMPRVEPHHDEG